MKEKKKKQDARVGRFLSCRDINGIFQIFPELCDSSWICCAAGELNCNVIKNRDGSSRIESDTFPSLVFFLLFRRASASAWHTRVDYYIKRKYLHIRAYKVFTHARCITHSRTLKYTAPVVIMFSFSRSSRSLNNSRTHSQVFS